VSEEPALVKVELHGKDEEVETLWAFRPASS
jgi:hypothetical protein